MPTLKQVACAVIRDPEGGILLARRAPGQHLEGHWELPGGKVKPGESLEAALEGELLEELGLMVTVGEELARTVYHYERGSIELLALATRTDGEIDHMTVHDAVHWFTAEETTTLVVAPADIPLLESLWKDKRALIGTPRPTSLR
jgi:8-oxo-dGTP diphosphatase